MRQDVCALVPVIVQLNPLAAGSTGDEKRSDIPLSSGTRRRGIRRSRLGEGRGDEKLQAKEEKWSSLSDSTISQLNSISRRQHQNQQQEKRRSCETSFPSLRPWDSLFKGSSESASTGFSYSPPLLTVSSTPSSVGAVAIVSRHHHHCRSSCLWLICRIRSSSSAAQTTHTRLSSHILASGSGAVSHTHSTNKHPLAASSLIIEPQEDDVSLITSGIQARSLSNIHPAIEAVKKRSLLSSRCLCEREIIYIWSRAKGQSGKWKREKSARNYCRRKEKRSRMNSPVISSNTFLLFSFCVSSVVSCYLSGQLVSRGRIEGLRSLQSASRQRYGSKDEPWVSLIVIIRIISQTKASTSQSDQANNRD